MKDNRSLVDAQEWNPIESDKFWEEISPDGHVVQIYENENDLLDLLESYVSGGIEANDCVILLATKPHLISLEARLQTSGYSIDRYITRHQYFPLDAEQFLQQFMVNDMPDELLFMEAVTAILGEARKTIGMSALSSKWFPFFGQPGTKRPRPVWKNYGIYFAKITIYPFFVPIQNPA